MSQVYSTEPDTTGRVVVVTTHGPIDINLWCKECPTTTRTFVQLARDGYYNGMIFHRIFSDFMIQTGLTRNESLVGTASAAEMDGYLRRSTPTSSRHGASGAGDTLGWDRKKLELNPRIRFNHRGQVAMAAPLEESAGDKDEDAAMLRYQFFLTLDEAPFLDGKHVVFGTVAGATMFNALRIGRTDVDEQSGIPTDMKDCPPRIVHIQVDSHPFEDMVMTADKNIPWKHAAKNAARTGTGKEENSAVEKRRKKRKGKRDLNVLSFGDAERGYDDMANMSNKGASMLSSHDVLSGESGFLSSKVDKAVDERSKEEIKAKKEQEGTINHEKKKATPNTDSSSNCNTTGACENSRKSHTTHVNTEMTKHEPKVGQASTREDQYHEIKNPTRSKGVGAVEARRAKYLKSGMGSSADNKERLKREGDTMAKLFAFKNKVINTKGSKKKGSENKTKEDDSLASRVAKRAKRTKAEEDLRNKEKEAIVAMPGYSGQVDVEDNDNGDDTIAEAGDWIRTRFKCKRHIDHDSRKTAMDRVGDTENIGGDGRDMRDYVVLDDKRQGRDKEDRSRKHRDIGRQNSRNDSRRHGGRAHTNTGHRRR